jgi:hypothetical protein
MSKTKLFVRMESEAGTEVVDTADVLAADTNAKVDAEAVTEAAADITQLDTGIDNALEAADEVSADSDTMAEAVADGDGLTPREAEMVEARLERAAALVGGDLTALGLTFRRESFGGKESRLAVTKMRLEAAEGFGKKIWDGLVKAWNWLKDAVTTLFSKLIKSSDSLEKRLKVLEAQVGNVKGKKKEAKLKTQAKTFSVEGKTSAETIAGFAKTVEQFDVILSDVNSFSTNLDDKMGVAGAELLKRVFKSAEKVSAKDVEKGAEAYGRLPGGRAIVVKTTKQSFAGVEVEIAALSVEQIDETLASEYDAPDEKALADIVAAGLKVTRSLKSFKKAEDGIKKVIDANVTFIQKMASANDSFSKAEDGSKKEEMKGTSDRARAMLKANHSQMKVLVGPVPGSFFALASGMADVVAAGVANFKEEAAA